MRLKYYTTYNDEVISESTNPDHVINYVEIGDVNEVEGITKSTELTFEKAPSRARRIAKSGDTIISTVRTYLKAIAFVDDASDNLVVSTGFAVFRPKRGIINDRFLGYLLRSKSLIEKVVAESVGVSYPAISPSKIADFQVSLPPLPTQQKIATYLDERTTRIDALITAKENLLDLLAERRAALIIRAVTRGLDENVELKPSGVEWLGEIPVGWEVKRLRHLGLVPLKYGANEPASENDENDTRYIRITDITEDGSLKPETRRSLPFEKAKDYLMENHDILLARSGATVGKSFYIPSLEEPACFAGYLIRFRANQAFINPAFMAMYLTSDLYWSWLNSSFIQATIQNVSGEKYNDLTVPLPPLDVQKTIMLVLGDELIKFKTMSTKITNSIHHLKEYRAALITAAVNGEINMT